jgi:4-amino-4-deoxy-L-arabinose transferase-like glycosyltransferase
MIAARESRPRASLVPPRWMPIKHFLMILSTFLLVYVISAGREYPDSQSYYALIRYLKGGHLECGIACKIQDGRVYGVLGLVIMRPLVPSVVSVIAPSDYRLGFAVVNGIFWLASSLLVYHSVAILFGENKTPLVASLLFLLNGDLVVYAPTALTDMGGFFFIVLFLFAYLALKSTHNSGLRFWMPLFVIAGLAALTRETTFMIPAIAILSELLMEKKFNVLSLLPGVAMVLFTSVWLSANNVSLYIFIEKYVAAMSQTQAVVLGRPHFLMAPVAGMMEWATFFVGTFGLGVFIIPYSLRKRTYVGFKFAVLTGVVFGLSTLIWTTVDARFTLVMFLPVMTLEAVGINEIARCIRGRLGQLTYLLSLGYYLFSAIYLNCFTDFFTKVPPYIASLFR